MITLMTNGIARSYKAIFSFLFLLARFHYVAYGQGKWKMIMSNCSWWESLFQLLYKNILIFCFSELFRCFYFIACEIRLHVMVLWHTQTSGHSKNKKNVMLLCMSGCIAHLACSSTLLNASSGNDKMSTKSYLLLYRVLPLYTVDMTINILCL